MFGLPCGLLIWESCDGWECGYLSPWVWHRILRTSFAVRFKWGYERAKIPVAIITSLVFYVGIVLCVGMWRKCGYLSPQV